MIKNKFIFFTVFIIIFFSLGNFLPLVYSLNAEISDAEDDVFQQCASGEIIGNYHDEIDIISLTISGQNVNLTVAGDLAQWNYSYYGSIIFSEKFYHDEGADFQWSPPYYTIDWNNFGGSMEVTLEKGYSLGGGNFAYEEWNGTGWEDRNTATAANILSSITEHSIIINIPDQVETIPDSMQVVAHTLISIYGGCDYQDITPIPSSNQKITSYNLLFIMVMLFVISIVLIKKYKIIKV